MQYSLHTQAGDFLGANQAVRLERMRNPERRRGLLGRRRGPGNRGQVYQVRQGSRGAIRGNRAEIRGGEGKDAKVIRITF